MTATVFVWEMGKTGVGHASMSIKGPSGDAYISWWPAASTSSAQRALHGIVSSGLVHSLRKDKEEDGIPDWASRPIDDLKEAAIISWWGTLAQSSNLKSGEEEAKSGHYVFLSNNCSTTVMRALLVGATPERRLQIRLHLLETTEQQAEESLSERVIGKVVGGYGSWEPAKRAVVELVAAKVKPGFVIAPFDVRYVVENVWR
jgi:hypothetical protein